MISAFGPQPRTVASPGPRPSVTEAALRRLRLAGGDGADDAGENEDDETDATLIRVPKPDDEDDDGGEDADGTADGED